VRIRTTTRPGTSPHPLSRTTAPNNVGSGHGGAPSPVIQVSGPQAIPSGHGAHQTPHATRTVPLAALWHVGTEGQV